jgi:hypothetical protein
MAYIPPPLPAAPAPAPRALGQAIAVGSAVAIACAVLLGLIGGRADRQFAYGAVLLGVFVGQAVRRIRRDTQAATAAALISLAGGALASLIGLTTRLVRAGHIPLAVVLAHISTVISILPRAIGVFGFVCWALAAYAGWADVGRRPAGGARTPGETAPVEQGQYYGPGQQPGDLPSAQPGHSGSGFAAPPGQAPGPGPAQLPDAR